MNTVYYSKRRYLTMKFSFQTLIGFVILLSLTPALSAQHNMALQLILEPSKNEVVIGEPLYAALRLRNTGKVTIEVVDNFHINNEAVAVVATDNQYCQDF